LSLLPVWACPSCPTRTGTPGGLGCEVYPSSLTDAQWALLEGCCRRGIAPVGGRPGEVPPAAGSSTRCSTWSGPGRRGDIRRTGSRPATRCTGSSPGGGPTGPGLASTTRAAAGSGWPLDANPPGDHRLAVGACRRDRGKDSPGLRRRESCRTADYAECGSEGVVVSGLRGDKRGMIRACRSWV
jgi:hypothetical protein